tara:strand:- start:3933 stop:4103 length:171 start_codon:yes stop_codon:yes gene_type:complete
MSDTEILLWADQKSGLFKKMSDTQILNWLVDQLETYVWDNEQDIMVLLHKVKEARK